MTLCNLNELELDARNPAPAPIAVPAGLLMMGLLLMTFEYPLTVLFGVFLAIWGAANLTLRAAKFACCLKYRKDRIARGKNAGPCTIF